MHATSFNQMYLIKSVNIILMLFCIYFNVSAFMVRTSGNNLYLRAEKVKCVSTLARVLFSLQIFNFAFHIQFPFINWNYTALGFFRQTAVL